MKLLNWRSWRQFNLEVWVPDFRFSSIWSFVYKPRTHVQIQTNASFSAGRKHGSTSDWIWTESLAERTRSFLICHASVVCNLKPSYWNDAKSSILEAIYGKVANILAYYSGVLRAVRGTSNFWGCADEITPNQRILNWIWGLQIATEHSLTYFWV